MSAKKYCKYDKEDLKRALEAVKQGTPFATAAKQYKVPRTTIIGKIKGIYPEECKSGASTVLTAAEEELLVQWIINMGRKGFPVTKDQLLDSVAHLIKRLERPNKFSNGRPGRHWLEGFLHRHLEITQRLSQNLSTSRANVTREKIQNWFKEIQEYFTSADVNITDPGRIFNTDESAFFLSPKGARVFAKKGSKVVHDRSGDDKECLTVLITGNANGQLVPPMIMFPYERIPKHIIMNVPNGWGIGKSPSGWMTSESFYEYVSNIFYPWVLSQNIEFPIILYLDGHKSHVTLPLTDFCREKQIIVISLLPNSTHILQPLDVGLFRTLKQSWKKQIQKFKTENAYKSLTRENFACVLNQALNAIPNMERVFRNAFRACGLFPFDPANVDYNKLLEENPKEKTAEIAENPEVIKHLRFLESYIEPQTLRAFYTAFDSGMDWTGNIEDETMYKTWHKMKQESGHPSQEKPNSNIVIQIEEGLVLEEGWEQLLVAEDTTQAIILEAAVMNNEEENMIPESEVSQDAIDFFTVEADIHVIDRAKDLVSTETEVFDNDKENDANIINRDVVTPTLQQREELVHNNQESHVNIINRNLVTPTEEQREELVHSNQEGDPNIMNRDSVTPTEQQRKEAQEKIPQRHCEVSDNPKPEHDRYSNVLPGVKIPTLFKESLFWPEPSTSKKPFSCKR